MGYESKLFVVSKTRRSYRDDERVWGEVIATFDLCKVYDVSDVIRNKYKPTNCFIYSDNGNDEILEDMYGEPLREVPFSDMIEIIEKAAAKDDYRRYAPCLGLLKGFNLDEWNNLVVLHYGH